MQRTDINNLIDHLFRHESGKLVSILTRIFGPDRLVLAEDVVQETLLDAMEIWKYNGVPDNPAAWLHTAAKNKTLNVLKREKIKHRYAEENAASIMEEEHSSGSTKNYFSENEVADDQLRMMFTCCHPSITKDSQIALALKTLCGFSTLEIAHSFFSTEETIKKRLTRARTVIREQNILYEVPTGKELDARLYSVLEVIYVLFNEGYSASNGDHLIRFDLCGEAIRLAELISRHPSLQNRPIVLALLAMMYLNASRFVSRQDAQGKIIPMSEQDRSLWDRTLMRKGFEYLEQSMDKEQFSLYHTLAAISACHCAAPGFEETDWGRIVSLYDHLLTLDNSPIVTLNRAIALSYFKGIDAAIGELEQIQNHPAVASYHPFNASLGEFYLKAKRYQKAKEHFEKGLKFSKIQAEKEHFSERITLCNKMIK